MEWKDIDTKYEISNEGSIRNKTTKRILKTGFDGQDRYLIWKTNSACHLVHRLVATAFLSNPLGLRDVNHKNGNKIDNRVENLEWVSHSDNMRHGYTEGLIPRTKGFCQERPIWISKDNEVRKFNSISDAARFLGVGQTAVSNCLYGRSKSCRGWKPSFSLINNETYQVAELKKEVESIV
jgi:hypothetical protein